MQKLVLTFGYGDGCSYGGTETIPFEYESAGKATEDFLTLWEEKKTIYENFQKWKEGKAIIDLLHGGRYSDEYKLRTSAREEWPYITFIGEEFEVTGEMPNILTLEDWFEQNKSH